MKHSDSQLNLLRMILVDIWHYKQALVVLLLNLSLALSVVWITHQSRLLVEARELLMMDRDAINIEFRHLQIEQNALAEHSRVRQIARTQLAMERPSLEQQIVVYLE